MKLYEIKVYTQIDGHSELVDYLKKIIVEEEQFTLKQSWENGYHLSLYGWFEPERAEAIQKQLTQLQEEAPASLYDEDEFRNKYAKVAELTGQVEDLEEIIQNSTRMVLKEDYDIFENKEQVNVYLQTNHVFDRYFAANYFQENQILDIILSLYEFVNWLPEKDYAGTGIVSNGYTSHYSHFIGLLNSLTPESREKVKKQFADRVQQDLPLFHERKKESNQGFLEELISVYQMVGEYVEQGKITFFSPNKSETEILDNLHLYSKQHAAIFGNKEYRDIIRNDKVLCTNRWVLNVFYEKLVLLNIKPIEKFYLNYFFSSLKYDQASLEVM